MNYKAFYSGSQEQLIELARIAYETLKEVDPEIVLVSPSVVGSDRHLKWLDDYLAKGGGRYADVISYHFYVPKEPPEAMLPLVAQVREIMRKNGQANKPLWNTETGWWLQNHPDTPPTGSAAPDWLKLDSDRASAYVARALILGWAAGLSRYYWYAWDNLDMGMIEPGSLTPKPVTTAYSAVTQWLLGNSMKGCERSGALWVCGLTLATGAAAGSATLLAKHRPANCRP